MHKFFYLFGLIFWFCAGMDAVAQRPIAGSGNAEFQRINLKAKEPQGSVYIEYPENRSADLDPALVRVKVKSNGASSYTVALSSSHNFKNLTYYKTSTYPEQTDFVFTDLQPNRNYYVKAKANTSSTYGPVVVFNTKKNQAPLLWGVTTRGGTNNQGTVFNFDPQTKTFKNYYDYSHPEYFIALSGNAVKTPNGLAVMSVADGTGGGQIVTISDNGENKIIEEYAAHNGSLTLGSDNYLYVIDDWIEYFRGGIYKIHSEGDDVHPLERIIFRFETPEHGLNPTSQLLEYGDGFMYGVAPYEGQLNYGTLYKLKMDGSEFQVIHHFGGEEGGNPAGALVKGEDGLLYGVTEFGGTHNHGVVYRVSADGANFQTIFNFDGTRGKNPKANLLWLNGILYGTTSMGGTSDQGVVFALKPDGTDFQVLHNFNMSSGSTPLGGLVSNESGDLFGMTSAGGANGLGTIYSVNPSTKSFQLLFSFSESTGGAPNGSLLWKVDPNSTRNRPEVARKSATARLIVGPNPFRETFTAEFRTTSDVTIDYQLTDMNGTLLKQVNGASNIGVQLGEDLPNGVYILKARIGSEVWTEKVVKK